MDEEVQGLGDVAQLEKIMNIVKLVQGFQGNNTQNKEEENKQSEQSEALIQEKKSFDDEFQAPTLRVIKAAIPYLDYSYQKNLAMMIKLIEIDSLLKRYSKLSVEGQDIKSDSKKNMLMAIKPELELKQQKVLDMFVKIVEIKEIMEGLNNGGY